LYLYIALSEQRETSGLSGATARHRLFWPNHRRGLTCWIRGYAGCARIYCPRGVGCSTPLSLL